MSWEFEGQIIWLMGSNRVSHHISQVAVYERPGPSLMKKSL